MLRSPPPRPVRDAVTTIRPDGSHAVLYPADVRGRFARGRRLVAYALIGVYLLLPWIKVGGYPAVFLDVASRRFHLFGLTLAAQDLSLLFFLITGLGFGLFFVTSLFGRLWCGWSCPQTVFLDHVYRRIERLIDGDSLGRSRLASAPMSPSKAARRLLKHAAYIVVSAGLVHLFAAYFVSVPAVWAMVREAPGRNWGWFVFMAVATGAIYFNFAWFREQLCILICPYGRIQSALTDEHTLVIGYDRQRGEPRGHLGVPDAGACIACDRCVKVCPTGIDIRQGLQMECIGCAACIDACDDVMDRTGRARGLVRYDSFAGLSGRRTRWLRPRTLIYFVLLVVGISVALWAVAGVRPASMTVNRMVGAPYYSDAATVRNQFLVRLVNKSSAPVLLFVTLQGLPAGTVAKGFEAPVPIEALGEEVRPLIVVEARSAYKASFPFEVTVSDAQGHFHITRAMEFLGPDDPGALQVP